MRAAVGVLAILALLSAPAFPQDVVDLDRLVTRFLSASDEYRKIFRNLVAEETKVIEVYKASGAIDKRRQIVSDLLVYQPRRGAKDDAVEYRDVYSVDGKVVERRGERALKLIENASRAKSLEKELEAINRETFRHEFDRHLSGVAISQAGLSHERRDAFQFEQAGRDRIGGRDVIVVSYRQKPTTPSRTRLPLPKEVRDPSFLQGGRLWLDPETGHVWRDVWEITVSSSSFSERHVIIHKESVYVPSRFGIPVPERIEFQWRLRYSGPKDGGPSFGLSERTTFTYGSFKRFDVATQENVQLPNADGR
jgi:hypothetical protein